MSGAEALLVGVILGFPLGYVAVGLFLIHGRKWRGVAR